MYAFALVVEETLVAVWDVGLLTGSSTERGNLQSTIADREITHGMDVGICVSNDVLASSSLCLAFFVSWFSWYICVVQIRSDRQCGLMDEIKFYGNSKASFERLCSRSD